MFDADTYRMIRTELKDRAVLCAVSKQRPSRDIQSAYDLGQRIFAENKANELAEKASSLPSDIEWHFIGHLQRNKVRTVLPHVSLIQSLDSLRLAREIEKEAVRINRVVPCLLEFHLAESDLNKTGLSPDEALDTLKACRDFPHLRITGMMAMGPHTDEEAEILRVFERGHELFETLQRESDEIRILSMGMSDDYPLALKAGANMVRIGSRLFSREEES